jgi:hypothetical protein
LRDEMAINNPAFDHLIFIYYVSTFIFVLIPFIIYYFKSKAFMRPISTDKKIKIILIAFVFFASFLIIDQLSREDSNITSINSDFNIIRHPSEFFWVNMFFLIGYLIILSYTWNTIFSYEIIIPSTLPTAALERLNEKTSKKLGARTYRNTQQSGADAYFNGSFFTRFDVFLDVTKDPEKGISVHLVNSLRNLRILGVFGFLIYFPLINIRSEQIPPKTMSEVEILTWVVQLFQNTYKIDVVFWFICIGIFFCLFGVTLSAIEENILIEFEEAFKEVKLGQAIGLKKPKITKKLPDKPDLSIDEIRSKALAKKEAATKKLELEKKERIDKILGEKKEEKSVNPEVLRLEALIRSVKTILQSTPLQRVVKIEEIINLLGNKVKTTSEEVQSIIIGLLQKNELHGDYDIWKKEYSGGTPARRFVDKTLDSSSDFMEGLNTIKIKSDGSVEFHYNMGQNPYPDIDVKNKEQNTTKDKGKKAKKK